MSGSGKRSPLSKLLCCTSSARSPSPSPTRPPTSPPAQFLCSLCSLLLSDPVTIWLGQSFHDHCHRAFFNIDFAPPALLPPDSAHIVTSFASLLDKRTSDEPIFKPAPDLYQKVLDWCRNYGHPLPTPITPGFASHFASGTKSMLELSHPQPPIPPPPFSIEPDTEEGILERLKESATDKESALNTLLENLLCSPRIFSSIIPLLASEEPRLQVLTARVMLSLSADPTNRTHIYRAGAITHLITVLESSSIQESCEAAFGALCRMAADERYCVAIGALEAIPPLLRMFCNHYQDNDSRRQAATALTHLVRCAENVKVLVGKGGVEKIMPPAEDLQLPRDLRKHALMLVHEMVSVRKAVAEMMIDGGGFEGLLRLTGEGGEVVGKASLTVMFRICRENMEKFRDKVQGLDVENLLENEKDC